MKTFFLILLSACFICCNNPQQGNGTVKTLSPTEYLTHHDKDKSAVLVDVRTPAEFEAGHIENTKNVDFLSGDFAREMQSWDRDKTYYLYCATGNRSGKAAQQMLEAGFKNVYNIGGFENLRKAGLPVKE